MQIALQAPSSSPSSSSCSKEDCIWRTCVLGIVTQGNLARERGLSIPVPLPFAKEEIPDRIRECVLGLQPDWYIDVAPVIANFETWMPRFGGGDEVVEAYGNPRL